VRNAQLILQLGVFFPRVQALLLHQNSLSASCDAFNFHSRYECEN
jgi:hypothetical protein